MPWKEVRSHNSVAPIKNSPRGCPSRSRLFANRAVGATATASLATKRPPHRRCQTWNQEHHQDPQSVHEGLTQGHYREAIFTAGALIGKVAGRDRGNQPELPDSCHSRRSAERRAAPVDDPRRHRRFTPLTRKWGASIDRQWVLSTSADCGDRPLSRYQDGGAIAL